MLCNTSGEAVLLRLCNANGCTTLHRLNCNQLSLGGIAQAFIFTFNHIQDLVHNTK